MHQANGRFVYAGLNADFSHKYDVTYVFYCINQDTITTNCANEF